MKVNYTLYMINIINNNEGLRQMSKENYFQNAIWNYGLFNTYHLS